MPVRRQGALTKVVDPWRLWTPINYFYRKKKDDGSSQSFVAPFDYGHTPFVCPSDQSSDALSPVCRCLFPASPFDVNMYKRKKQLVLKKTRKTQAPKWPAPKHHPKPSKTIPLPATSKSRNPTKIINTTLFKNTIHQPHVLEPEAISSDAKPVNSSRGSKNCSKTAPKCQKTK